LNEESLSVSSTKSKHFRDGALNLPISRFTSHLVVNKTPIEISRKSLVKTNLGNRTKALIHLNKQVIKKYKLRAKDDEQKLNCIYLTHEGNRIKNEDRLSLEEFTLNQVSYQYAAVFDGHGGHLTSNYLANNLFGFIKSYLTEGKEPLEAMRLALLKVE
jgi:hypothetical protein